MLLDGETATTIRDRELAALPDTYAKGEGEVPWDILAAAALEIYDVAVVGGLAVLQRMFIGTSPGDTLDLHGEQFGVPRKPAAAAAVTLLVAGANGTVVEIGSTFTTAAGADGTPAQSFATSAEGVVAAGTAPVPATATVAGAAGNVAANTIVFASGVAAGVTGVRNPAAAGGGADAEDDEDYRARLLQAAAREPGSRYNADGYAALALAQPNVGWVLVDPFWAGDGTIRLVILDPAGEIPDAGTVAAVQAAIDPDMDGKGRGLAEITHVVTIVAPAATSAWVRIPSFVAEEGTPTATAKANAEAAIAAYFASVNPGGVVRVRDVESEVIDAAGVLDIGDIALSTDGATFTRANLALTAVQKVVVGGVSYV